jgi:hypothetical protein
MKVFAEALSKKELRIRQAPDNELSLQLQLEDLRRKQHRVDGFIRKVVLLENELGRPLTYQDLSGRFKPAQIDAINYSLHWLLDGQWPVQYNHHEYPSVEDGDNSSINTSETPRCYVLQPTCSVYEALC